MMYKTIMHIENKAFDMFIKTKVVLQETKRNWQHDTGIWIIDYDK